MEVEGVTRLRWKGGEERIGSVGCPQELIEDERVTRFGMLLEKRRGLVRWEVRSN
jgi:hypothetical protein